MQTSTIRTSLLALVMLCTSSLAFAGRVGVGIYVGPGAFYGPSPYYYPVAPVPYYYPPAVPYYYPPTVVVPAASSNYVEQGQPAVAPSANSSSWFYCDASKTYYPYVKQCAGGWRQVPAQPPSN